METLTQQKVTLKTSELQDLVSKASKVCTFIEAFPLTGAIELTCENGSLTITTTDNVNTLRLCKSGIEGSLHALVDSKLFSSLISKLTTPMTELIIEDNKLIVKANGSYDFSLITEEDGSSVSITKYEFDTNVPYNHISNNELKTILTMNKSCKADMKEMPSLYNYYMDAQRVLTTDFYKACINPIKLFNSAVCIPPTLMELTSLLVDDSGLDIQEDGNAILFTSSYGTLYGRKANQEDLDNYPVEELINLFNETLNYSCLLNKTLLMNALDRICLFTAGFDSNYVNLEFGRESVKLSTKRCNSCEVVRYLQPINIETNFSIELDGGFLKNQLNAYLKEDLLIKFGNSSGIQLICDSITQTLGSLGEEE